MILYLLVALLFILLCYGTGAVITYSFRLRLNPSLLPLIKIVSGLIAIISLYAITATKGKTIMLLLPIAGSLIYLHLKKHSSAPDYQNPSLLQTELKKIIFPLTTLFVLVLVAYGAQAWLYQGCFTFSSLPHIDYIYYAQVASSLNQYGVESTWLHFQELDAGYKGLAPYHYFELWACALVIKLTGLNQVAVLMLVIYPAFFAITGYSLIQLARIILPEQKKLSYLSVLLLFVTPLNWANLGGLDSFLLVGIVNNIKYLPITLFLILFVIALYKKSSLSWILLLLIPICSITTAPAIIGGVILYKLLSLLPAPFLREMKGTSYSFVTILLVAAAIGTFYSIFSYKLAMPHSYVSMETFVVHFKTLRNIILGAPLFLLYLFVPFFIPALLYFRKTLAIIQSPVYRSFLIWYTCILLSGLAAYSLIFSMPDASQLFSLWAYLGMEVLVILLYLELYQRLADKARYLHLTLVVLVLCGSIHAGWVTHKYFNYTGAFSAEKVKYMQQVDAVIRQHPEWKSGFNIKKPENFSSIYDYNILLLHPGSFTGLSDNHSNSINLNGPELTCADTDPINAKRKRNFQAVAPFYRYTSSLKSFRLEQLDSLRSIYIQQQQFPYGFVEDSALIPAGIKNNISSKITDPQSGEVFIVLKGTGRP